MATPKKKLALLLLHVSERIMTIINFNPILLFLLLILGEATNGSVETTNSVIYFMVFKKPRYVLAIRFLLILFFSHKSEIYLLSLSCVPFPHAAILSLF